jgi:hypothetical protein
LEVSLGVRGANAQVLLLFLHRLVEPFWLLLGLVTVPASVVLAVAFAITPAALSLAVLSAFISLTSLLSLAPSTVLLVAVATFAVLVALTIAPSKLRKTIVVLLLISLARAARLA